METPDTAALEPPVKRRTLMDQAAMFASEHIRLRSRETEGTFEFQFPKAELYKQSACSTCKLADKELDYFHGHHSRYFVELRYCMYKNSVLVGALTWKALLAAVVWTAMRMVSEMTRTTADFS
ncbi:hypothetical protein TruAng_002090 [Truncatella angustata]|nr:hypothetical protein TruAng_002090 [Truncatella angustata]